MVHEQTAESKYGRKAFGPQRTRSAAAKALHVAESILQHEIEGHPWSWTQYYRDVTSDQCLLAQALLRALRAQQAA